MNNGFDLIFKNEQLKSVFGLENPRSRYAHAYILSGPEGCGKHTAAKLICAALACENGKTAPCLSCDSCRRVINRLTPDIIYINKGEKKTIVVDTVRNLINQAYLSRVELECAVFVIEEAHLMNKNSQNALLKLLEEPPSGVYFILLTDSLSNIIPTVRSRAPAITMQTFSYDDVSDLPEWTERLKKEYPPLLLRSVWGTIPNTTREIKSFSGRKTLFDILKGSADDDYAKVIDEVFSSLARRDKTSFLLSLSSLSAGHFGEYLSSQSDYLMDMLTRKKSREAHPLAGNYTVKSLIAMIELTETTKSELLTNISEKYAQTAMLLKMWRICGK